MTRAYVLAALILAATAPTALAERIVLRGGAAVEGTVVKETGDAVFVDVGYTILQVPTKEIARREGGDDRSATGQEKRESLFSVADLPEASIRDLVARFGEAVVMITSPGGLGSGFIVHEDGYVVTNFHVIEGERDLTVTIFVKREKEFEKVKQTKVRIVAINPYVDLALLKIEDLGDLKLKKVYLGEMDELKVGDPVFAIGNPLGLERTVSEGIVSTKGREFEGLLYIQTDTAINPGNSGGALFNRRGQVVGVTNMGATYLQGLNFAIPVSYVKDFLKNVESFAYDKDNPNNGYRYLKPPRKRSRAPVNR